MLTPEYLDQLPDSVIALYQQAEMDILKDMVAKTFRTSLWRKPYEKRLLLLQEKNRPGALKRFLERDFAT